MRAFHEDGTEAKPGDKITSFRGEEWTLISLLRHKVYAERDGLNQVFFPYVFNLTVKENEE